MSWEEEAYDLVKPILTKMVIAGKDSKKEIN